ncbi:nickel-dependent hydrogenase large subunit [Hydrogenimonas thermophila]|uniref:Quinone-reactive Ni/Fe-hydrogenase large subunit n=1 Tax=Hydrogenimonas thermophila TaxID=223786 RepID=A0A1I5LNS8_9BACT|nr:nickel-dependent hydrogenase large subunit [Hydrogenimonas thermophila]WOE69904.1 nickel-dependent hydrogenase large subunit [Hydrogenimonas thermophila]WOE72419.1 nickel-dependent hydrogenase large subunit [Hydrogenimonas thermophila]SFO98895.1 quinone-reactive Ni/Fe-hydrogenase large subunit [Hydrogenimonas thermophila]
MGKKRVVVDPITRIEGHLRAEVVVNDEGVVENAYVSSTLWRGLEVIAKGRDPRDVPFMMQRICGVCTFSHYLKSTMAVEDALGIKIPLNAELTRTLMNISLFLHDHVVHFYQLHGLDWVDIVSALKADPKKASELAFKYADDPIATGVNDLIRVQEKVKKFAENPQGLGPFANAYWGHPTYRFTPEQNLIALSHYLKALELQRVAARMMAIFGGKNPHPQSLTVGGVTCIMDLQDPARMGEWMAQFQEMANFVINAYQADIIMAAEMYKDEPSVTKPIGVKNFMAHEDMLIGRGDYLFSSGYVLNGDLSKAFDINEDLITEEATHSWYKDNQPLHPYDGKTNPNYTGLRDGESVGPDGKMAHSKLIDESKKYSWIKSPRYDGQPMEVGPLACMVVSYAKGNKRVQKAVNDFLKRTGLPVEALFTTLGRTAGRMLQAKIIAENGLTAFNNLVENLKVDQTTCAPYVIDKNKEYKGRGIGDVPRGMLSHWIRIKNGVVENYQAVVPSTWNAGPMDANGRQGPYEADLVGLKIHDLTQPLEIIRIIHSYDPCIACAVHVMDTKGNKLSEYKLDPLYGTCSV